MAGPSELAKNGSETLEQPNNARDDSDNTPVDENVLELLTTRNAYPIIPWITESWLAKLVRHERIAVASPQIGMWLIGIELIKHHINLNPTLHSPADFIQVHDNRGQCLGARPKMATWPLTKDEALKNKEWSA